MDKQNMVKPYSGISWSLKGEGGSETYYNMDEPWKCYTKWDKADTEGQTLDDSIYKTYLEQVSSQSRIKSPGWGGAWRSGIESVLNEHEVLLLRKKSPKMDTP